MLLFLLYINYVSNHLLLVSDAERLIDPPSAFISKYVAPATVDTIKSVVAPGKTLIRLVNELHSESFIMILICLSPTNDVKSDIIGRTTSTVDELQSIPKV